MWGLPGAGAVLTPAGAGLLAQMPIGPNQIDPNQIGQGAGVLPHRQAQHRFGPGQIVRGADALAQGWKMRCQVLRRLPNQRHWWHRQVCGMPSLPIRHPRVAQGWQEWWRQF